MLEVVGAMEKMNRCLSAYSTYWQRQPVPTLSYYKFPETSIHFSSAFLVGLHVLKAIDDTFCHF